MKSIDVVAGEFLVIGHVSGKLTVKRRESKSALEESRARHEEDSASVAASAPSGKANHMSGTVRTEDKEGVQSISLARVSCKVGAEPPLPTMSSGSSNGASAAFVKALPSHSQQTHDKQGEGSGDAIRGNILGSFAVVWMDGRISICHITSRQRDTHLGESSLKTNVTWETMQCFHTKYVFHSIEYYISTHHWQAPKGAETGPFVESERSIVPNHSHLSNGFIAPSAVDMQSKDFVLQTPVSEDSVAMAATGLSEADRADESSTPASPHSRPSHLRRSHSRGCVGEAINCDKTIPYIVATSLTGHSIFVSLVASDFNLDSVDSKTCNCFDGNQGSSRQMLAFDSCHTFESSLCVGMCQGESWCVMYFTSISDSQLPV